MALDGSFEAIDNAGSYRLQIWQETVTLLPERLFTGHGTRGTGKLLRDQNPDGFDFGYEHLYWLEVAVGTGIPGLILYLAVFSYLVYLLLRRTHWAS
ncbi:O-antigen ligase family protein, partial [Arthrospira platensis SPKY1]|nr:O-antigen ligase family protein [Arthrospira platensis SPKY1]